LAWAEARLAFLMRYRLDFTKRRLTHLFCLALLCAAPVFSDESAAVVAQEHDQPIRAKRRLGFGFYFLGPDGIYGGWLNYYILPMIAIEAGGTYYAVRDPSAVTHVGLRWYFGTKRQAGEWQPYVGAFFQRSVKINDNTGHPNIDFYFPLGLESVSIDGLTLAIEIALDMYMLAYGLPWGGIKIGYHF